MECYSCGRPRQTASKGHCERFTAAQASAWNYRGSGHWRRPSPVDQCGASWNSRIAARTHQQEDRNVDCASNSRFVGLVDRNPCYVHGLRRSGRLGRPAAFDRRSGSRRAPLESKTFAIGRTSPCSVRASRRRAGRQPLDRAIFRFRLVSWTCVWTVLAPPRGCGHFGQVLGGWAGDTCWPRLPSRGGSPLPPIHCLPRSPTFGGSNENNVLRRYPSFLVAR